MKNCDRCDYSADFYIRVRTFHGLTPVNEDEVYTDEDWCSICVTER